MIHRMHLLNAVLVTVIMPLALLMYACMLICPDAKWRGKYASARRVSLIEFLGEDIKTK